MQRTCVKCGHVHSQASGSDSEACPGCGAIYSKAASGARPVTSRPRNTGFGPTAGLSADKSGDEPSPVEYAAVLRSQTLYPTFRAVVAVGYWVTLAIAAACVLGGVIAFFSNGGIAAAAVALLVALVLWIVARFCKEASLMLADVCDAAVRAARAAEYLHR